MGLFNAMRFFEQVLNEIRLRLIHVALVRSNGAPQYIVSDEKAVRFYKFFNKDNRSSSIKNELYRKYGKYGNLTFFFD